MTHKYKKIIIDGGVEVKAWVEGVPVEEKALEQIQNISRLPIVHSHIAIMPDVHFGYGATVGSVIPTKEAIIPAAVGVDIGCGMMAVKTSLKASDLPENLFDLRCQIERSVPHGKTRGKNKLDRGAFSKILEPQAEAWASLKLGFDKIVERHPKVGGKKVNHVNHLGTLGTGNHFVELCLDEKDFLWVMLHSGSRGVGNKIGTYFIELAKNDMKEAHWNIPDEDLSYFKEGSQYFEDYFFAVEWAQVFARVNREIMMSAVLKVLRYSKELPDFICDEMAINCHHNYVKKEFHFGQEVFLTRKGAVSARKGELGIIPGSMGAKSFIVRGKGSCDSFHSCSHGAGRKMSRTQAKKEFSLQDHEEATKGVECRKDQGVIDETPGAYKSIEDVMEAQSDLVEVVHTLKQILCIKG